MLIRISIICSLLGCIQFGCTATQTVGTKLDPNKVARIQKGVTSRSEVESLLGPPTNVAMMDRGRRVMIYNFMESGGHVKPQTYIPVVGLFAGANEARSRTQMLQIYLDTRSVVEDYEFNDRTNITEGSGVGGLTHVKTRSEPTQKE